MPSREQIEDALRKVIDPELRKDIVSLGMVRSIEQPEEGRVDVIVSLTTAGCPIRAHFEKAVVESVQALGVQTVTVGTPSAWTLSTTAFSKWARIGQPGVVSETTTSTRPSSGCSIDRTMPSDTMSLRSSGSMTLRRAS